MIRQSYSFEVITPCFCGGAKPDEQAEIRPASIRGQLRWWFRLLGGFKSLSNPRMTLRQQEDLVFGTTAGNGGRAGKLMVRVSDVESPHTVVDDTALSAGLGTAKGYLLFPLRPEREGRLDERRRDRAAIMKEAAQDSMVPSFTLHLHWFGNASVGTDLRALATVFGHLGSLGFRSRRAMGALRLVHAPMQLAEALAHFSNPSSIAVFSRSARSADDAITKLAEWLRSWRAHGRTGNNDTEYGYPGFRFAQSDHFARDYHAGPGYRAVLGMPLLTKYGNWNSECPSPGKQTAGRFASPIILRPHYDGQHWLAEVIFVHKMQWPIDPHTRLPRKVFLDRALREVSTDLYKAMQDSLLANASLKAHDVTWCKLH